MTPAQALLRDAIAAEEAGRTGDARRAVERAVENAQSRHDKFAALLHLARCQAIAGELERALATYWDARHVTQAGKDETTGEADLGIGLTLLDLGRRAEAIETIRRASRSFRRCGNVLLAGCTELALADDLVTAGDLDGAERHMDVASDLLRAAGDPRLLSSLATLRAEVQVRQGFDELAEGFLGEARDAARDVRDRRAADDLRRRREGVRDLIRHVRRDGLAGDPAGS